MIEVLKQALKALEANDQLINGNGTKGGLVYCMDGYYSDCFDVDPINKQTDEAIAAIKEALAQPHETTLKEFNQQIHDDPNYHIWVKEREDQSKPELDALQVLANENQRMAKIIAELDAKRTWVGLTDEETAECFETKVISDRLKADAKRIEAKLKQKNG